VFYSAKLLAKMAKSTTDDLRNLFQYFTLSHHETKIIALDLVDFVFYGSSPYRQPSPNSKDVWILVNEYLLKEEKAHKDPSTGVEIHYCKSSMSLHEIIGIFSIIVRYAKRCGCVDKAYVMAYQAGAELAPKIRNWLQSSGGWSVVIAQHYAGSPTTKTSETPSKTITKAVVNSIIDVCLCICAIRVIVAFIR
jgi:hypothetical protein